MLNKEFQELKAQWGTNSTEREIIIEKMKENLKSRNNGESKYVFEYTNSKKIVDIDACSNFPEDLFEIDGDMNPMGK
ncbi:MAG: hypothetical protein IKN15_00800 [Bacteroidaceae bacterium]|nr:hypothetical protein [Bacteroidaceae bacterium]